jgi:hypothetical protein
MQQLVTFALKYWLHSEIHHRTAVNPAYREVGIAAVRYKKSYIIMAVFGARPNILPVFVFPEEGTIYLTNEQYKWKRGGNWVQDAIKIEILNNDGKPIVAGPMKFTAKMPIPQGIASFEVVFHDGLRIARTTVNLSTDVVLLPRNLQVAKNAAAQGPKVASVSNPIATNTKAAPAKAVAGLPPTNTPRPPAGIPPTNTPRPQIQPTQVQPTQDPQALINIDAYGQSVIMVLYNNVSLVIVNHTNKAADVSEFKLRYQGKFLEAKRWMKVISVGLAQFPASHCLMLELNKTDPFQPEACSVLRSVIMVQSDKRFWLQQDFEVLRGNQVVGVCKKAEAGEEAHCEIAWK